MFIRLYSLILLTWIVKSYIVISVSSESLNEYITKYEPLNYNKKVVDSQHLRRKRSLDDPFIHLNFNSHNRLFRLRLQPDLVTFNGNQFYFDGIDSDFDLSHIYRGFVDGVNGSHIHGSIIDGVFSGRIYFPDETFYVERSELYLSEPVDFHSVIYSERDVIDHPHDPKRIKRDSSEHHAGCGVSDDDIHTWMTRVQKSAMERNIHQQWHKYSYQMNRRKRAATDDRTQCSLYLQTDYTLWSYMESLNYGKDRIKAEITSLLATHVDGLNSIYGKTTFVYKDMGPYKGFNFVVHRIQINTTETCATNPSLGFCRPNLDASNYLNIHSLTNHDPYCLAFVFSYRQFSQGTIGLAWVGSPGSSGGVCERWKKYDENKMEVPKSLNTGIVTLCNYNARVPLKVSILTFAHEIGHNFGSPHDSGQTCIPLLANPHNKKGNYLMFASATSGLQDNNDNFSTCSIGNITQNLDAIFHNVMGRFNCFTQREDAFCGNGIVETDPRSNKTEECDCGFENDCREDRCCNPRKDGEGDALACTRKQNALCSSSEGPCCNPSNCQFVSKNDTTCKQETECSYSSACDGSQARCPAPQSKPDKTPCNNNTQICHDGECTLSICENISWKVCYPQAPTTNDRKFDRGLLCFVSCMNPSTNSCVSTGNKDHVALPENKKLQDLLKVLNQYDSSGNSKGIQMPAGAPCNNFRGYCDVFYKCRAVNEEGPLAQLKKLLFNEETVSQIKKYVTTYWWVVLLAGVAFIIVMALFIKICAVHTPSSNPKMKKARQLSLRRKRKQTNDMKLTVSSISGGADILRAPQHKTSRNL